LWAKGQSWEPGTGDGNEAEGSSRIDGGLPSVMARA